MLVGEPGIGKSRLAHEVADRARAAGVATYWGRCWESGGQPAFWPWIQILREVVRAVGPDELAAVLGGGVADLARLVPEVAGPGAEAAGSPLTSSDAQFRLFDAVARFLVGAARRAPMLLILEDLHAGDRSTAELLDFVARSIDGASIAVVGTYRDADARVAGLTDLLCKAGRSARTLSLGPLAPAEVAALVRSFADDELAADGLERLVRASEGNPLFVGELVRRGDADGVPDGIAAVIRERLGALPPSTSTVLEEASVIGRDIDVAVLAAAVARPAADIHADLQPAVAQQMLAAHGSDRYSFAHILVRETLYRSLAPPRRLALHRAVANALGTRPARERQVSEIAYHYDQAGPAAGAEAIAAYRDAAAVADGRLAYGEVAQLLSRALQLHTQVAPDDRAGRCELLIDLGRAYGRAGHPDDARQSCVEAVELARELDNSELRARAALVYGSVYTLGRTDSRLVELLEDALAHLSDEHSGLRARCSARLAAALQPSPDPAGPIAMAMDALALARSVGDPHILLETLRSVASALMDLEDPRVRVAVNREHVDLARKLGDGADVLRGTARLVLDYAELGDMASADATVEAYVREAAAVDHPPYEWQAVSLRAMRLIMRGCFDEAAVLVERATEIAAAAADPQLLFYTEIQALGLARARYDDDGLREQLPRAQFLDAVGDRIGRLVRAAFYAHLEDRAQVAALIGELDTAAFINRGDPHLETCAAEVAFALDWDELAAATYPELRPMAHRNASWGLVCMVCDGPTERGLALCCAARGDIAGAARHFDAAVARCGDEQPGALARVLYEHGLVQLRPGGDRERARQLLASARELATSLGMTGLERRIDVAGAGSAVRPAAAADEVRMYRDGEVWAVEYRGEATRCKDSKGLHILARLLAEPGREFHVLDLVGTGEAVDGGDAGELLDDQAIASYRARLTDLRAEVAEAEDWNDRARSERAQREIDALTAELAGAVGLGGRKRTAGTAAERARVNVRKRLRHALRRIGEQQPALARYLDKTVKTGVFCSYEPV